MRLIGLLCVRNEAGRYLERVLRWHSAFLDAMFVVDDRSTDDTVAIAEQYAHVLRRPEASVSFLGHEAKFRENAWASCGFVLGLTSEDWVFAIDADEFFVATVESERATLDRMMRDAGGSPSVTFRVDEIFKDEHGHPHRRVDGYWGTITATRLARYVPTLGSFLDRRMGGGSVPSYAYLRSFDATRAPASILHYGYARSEDRALKHERYANHPDSGHNPSHIASILTTPKLEAMTVTSPL